MDHIITYRDLETIYHSRPYRLPHREQTMPQPVQDKNGEPIKEGDHVWTPMRGGRHEGDVEEIVTTEERAEEAGVKNPPKILFVDQHGHKVSHNPGTLQHGKKKDSD